MIALTLARGSRHSLPRVVVAVSFSRAIFDLQTQLRRIIRKAGLDPWTRVWHNLRSSRETELAATFPVHVVCAWMGHAALIAQRHYL